MLYLLRRPLTIILSLENIIVLVVTEDLSIQSFNYINNYSYVGFKRPELVVAGRKLNESNGFHITEDIDFCFWNKYCHKNQFRMDS